MTLSSKSRDANPKIRPNIKKFDLATFIFRPPGTISSGQASVSPQMFFFVQRPISEVPLPIATKLCHIIGIWFYFIMQVQKFRERPPQKKYWGPKTCKISVNVLQRPTLIANISGTA